MRLKNLIISVCAVILLVIPLLLPAITNVALERDIAPSWLQTYGAYKELPAYYHFLRRNHKVDSEKWLRASIKLSVDIPEVSYEVSEYYRHLGRDNQALFWLKKSANKGVEKAILRLAKYYIAEKQVVKADRLLSSSMQHRDVLELSIETALMLGDELQFKERKNILANIDKRAPLLVTLSNFSIFEQLQPLNRQCVINIQPIATKLNDLILLQHRISELSAFPINDFICFEKPLYHPLKALACFHQNAERIQCNVNIWQSYPLTHVDYLLIMSPEGGANVDHGIIYIDRHDTIDVLVHELMHSFGFIDEYPLPLNHQRCSTAQTKPFAHNVVVLENEVLYGDRKKLRTKVLEQLPWRDHILPTTPILTAVENGWQVGTSEMQNNLVGLYHSRTCHGNRTGNKTAIKLQAFKPIQSKTKLEYFELKVPTLYWQILKQQPKRFLMPDHRVNAQRLH
ncbi:hypothetical protein [Thalassotalea sp. PP2-459]|uniref:hypothetical protein n=1 Tax=Thalassotalea sp. PP2-459 TaxID=1742724 RepID=UPI0009459713|nr:hypothetical protein [Thalassotalea sp. PP2-459]OKY27208.1 hypothetical protein BI291_09775 [Thalassotalea sp. PP2-459]